MSVLRLCLAAVLLAAAPFCLAPVASAADPAEPASSASPASEPSEAIDTVETVEAIENTQRTPAQASDDQADADSPAQHTGPGKAAIASAHHLATEAGHEILAAGGNAFDAAVAVAMALAVVEPASSGIGGGGFFLLHRASDHKDIFVDARETAPAAVNRRWFLDEDGQADRDKSVNGPLAAGIPGQPAGLAWLAEHYGQLPLSESLAPSIRLARDGFPVDDKYRTLIGSRVDVLKRWPTGARQFLVAGKIPELGHVIKQPDLAATIERLAEHGFDGFYSGQTARRLVTGVNEAGGAWTLDDLAGYQVKEREPIRIDYGGRTVVTSPPPSSGGVALAQMLNILSAWELPKLRPAQRVHLITEAMRRAYRDRGIYLGDPDFVDMPLAMLTSPDYAAGLRASIMPDKATPSAMLPGADNAQRGTDTTHFSIIDGDGNLVAATLSVNLPYGSGFVPPGTGVLLNNEMDDFALVPDEPNAYGLIGRDANAPAPGKRMLSSMTPTFLRDDQRVVVIGTPGGSRIITMILLGLFDAAEGASAETIVAAPRFHHQYLPDVISVEPDGQPADVVEALRELGHTVNFGQRQWGNMQVVLWDRATGRLEAASDPRWDSGRGSVQ
ncbi:MAG: gamma-glutamyltransferase [Xanthomonadales bacterium]|nr:gamma-glutamyltransferase [Xanthomonadales bacterium]